jgi:hypothetical protein
MKNAILVQVVCYALLVGCLTSPWAHATEPLTTGERGQRLLSGTHAFPAKPAAADRSACPPSRCPSSDAARDERRAAVSECEAAVRSLWHCRAIHCEPQTRKRQRRGRRPVKQPNRDQGQNRWVRISPPIMNGLRRAVCPLFAGYGSISSPMAALMRACVRVGTPSLRRALSR